MIGGIAAPPERRRIRKLKAFEQDIVQYRLTSTLLSYALSSEQ